MKIPAGSGKSYLSLLKAVKWINDPAARIMVVRQSYPQLKDLINESKNIYPHFGGEFKVQAKTWVFPNGAEVEFKAMPKDLYELQGTQKTQFLVDEAAEFELADILMLFSRLRSATYKPHMSILLTCNPNKQSFLLPWVEYALDADGVPRPGTENKIRYFVIQNSSVKWADSEEELYELYGKGLERGTEFVAMKFKFIPMLCYDNKVLMKADPGYVGRLLSQPRVNQLRLLRGSWYAAVQGSTSVTEDMFEIVDMPPTNPTSKVRGWDLAASVPNESNQYRCDWTAGVLMSRDKFGTYYVEDLVHFQKQIDGVLEGIKDTAWRDGLDIVQILPGDPGQAGKVASRFYTSFLAESGVTTRIDDVGTTSGKVTRFGPFASLAARGMVKLVRGAWNREWLDEVCFFTGERKNHDDIVDACSTSANALAKQVTMPSFVIPDMSKPSPVPRIN